MQPVIVYAIRRKPCLNIRQHHTVVQMGKNPLLDQKGGVRMSKKSQRSSSSNRNGRKNSYNNNSSNNANHTTNNQSNTAENLSGLSSDDLEIIAAFLAVAADVVALLSLLKARDEKIQGEGDGESGLPDVLLTSLRGGVKSKNRRRPR